MRKEYSAQYFPVNGVDDGDEKLLHRGFALSRLWLIHGVLIFLTLLFFTLWARAPSRDDILLYSPANEAIESKAIVRFNGSWDRPSVYRGSPSPDLEAAWSRVTADGRPLSITLEQLLKMGEEPAPFMVRFPEEYGGNYMASVEVLHQLHCINMVRKSVWGNYYMTDDPDFVRWRTHPNHCVEILRQAIMCHSDVTMVTYDWVEGLDDPYPDFNVPHQCSDFEKVIDWVDGHRVYIPPSQLIRQEGNADLPYLP